VQTIYPYFSDTQEKNISINIHRWDLISCLWNQFLSFVGWSTVHIQIDGEICL
jgi:hypothetical protein